MEWSILILGAVTVGLVEVVKRTELISQKFTPIVALLVGIAISFLGGSLIGLLGVEEKILTGIILGLTSVGLYSGVKSVGEGIERNR